jgi:hypothetical protein
MAEVSVSMHAVLYANTAFAEDVSDMSTSLPHLTATLTPLMSSTAQRLR